MILPNALLTDLYQLTMLQGYFDRNMEESAVFEFFVRKLPDERNFLIAAGLEQVLEFLIHLKFSETEIEWLEKNGHFNNRFLQYLSNLRFTGDVHAMPEGTPFFADEPILRITAPLPQAQLVESRIINLLHYQTLIASKAARFVLTAPNKLLVDFGFRRAHGGEAGLLAARASYLAGFAGSATVLAAQEFGIPVYGTMAHSFIQAHDDETAAFEHFALANPDNVVLLLDTYDTEAGAKKVVELSEKLTAKGITIKGVRLDSGNLLELSKSVRKILNEGGLSDTTIFASGGIDEFQLASLESNAAPIDGYGIGTHMDTSADAPYLDCAYKLEEYAGIARRKLSTGKATWPGSKQVYRNFNTDGTITGDTITLSNVKCEGQALLTQVMENGVILCSAKPSLQQIRQHTLSQLHRLPDNLKTLSISRDYPVEISPELKQLAEFVDKRQRSE